MTILSPLYRKDTYTKLLLVLGGVVLLLLTLYMLHYWLLLGLVEGGLAPWDYGLERPPSSGWQRVVNDYFTGPPGENTPSLIAFTTMTLLLVVRYKRDKNPLLPLEFGLLNIAFTIGGSILLAIVMGIYRPLIGLITPDHQQGFHATGPGILISIGVLLGPFYSQATGWLFKKIPWRPSLQVVAMLLAIALAWLLCGPGIAYQLFNK